jgi:hypothetical protein
VALGQAITDRGEPASTPIVAVRHPPPRRRIARSRWCRLRRCRELIWDYDRNARVIVPGPNGRCRADRRAAAEQIQPRARDLSVSTTPRRLVSAERRDDDAAETSLRPQRLSEFIGQQQARANLSIFIEAARARTRRSITCCSSGPPGLGKTTSRRSSRASSASTSAPPRGR